MPTSILRCSHPFSKQRRSRGRRTTRFLPSRLLICGIPVRLWERQWEISTARSSRHLSATLCGQAPPIQIRQLCPCATLGGQSAYPSQLGWQKPQRRRYPCHRRKIGGSLRGALSGERRAPDESQLDPDHRQTGIEGRPPGQHGFPAQPHIVKIVRHGSRREQITLQYKQSDASRH